MIEHDNKPSVIFYDPLGESTFRGLTNSASASTGGRPRKAKHARKLTGAAREAGRANAVAGVVQDLQRLINANPPRKANNNYPT